MKRHASTDELADLAAGVLRPRRAAKIGAHLAGCTQCTDVSNQLASVSSTLASVSVAPMPELMSSRIETALAAESAHRLASAPATEAGRRELPARSRHSRPSGQGWRIFGLSGPASRLVTAAGALVVIGGGGYVIAAEVNSGPATNQSASSAGSAHVPTQHLNAGLERFPITMAAPRRSCIRSPLARTSPAITWAGTRSQRSRRPATAASSPAPGRRARRGPHRRQPWRPAPAALVRASSPVASARSRPARLCCSLTSPSSTGNPRSLSLSPPPRQDRRRSGPCGIAAQRQIPRYSITRRWRTPRLAHWESPGPAGG